jgi:hypothetical protein
VKLLWENGFELDNLSDVTEEHMAEYVRLRVAAGDKPRSVQNGLSAVRRTLHHRNRGTFADSDALKSPALGCPPGSRAGTNEAMPQAEVDALLSDAGELDDGLECVLRLERLLGLRRQEAIMSTQSLDAWAAQLTTAARIYVEHGSKGGRPRWARVSDREACLDAVQRAIAVRDKRDGVLIEKPSLYQALKRYEYFMGRTRLAKKGHSLRYSYSHERMADDRTAGFDDDTALTRVVEDLGHGSGRGRWGRDIYLRSVVQVKRKPKRNYRVYPRRPKT